VEELKNETLLINLICNFPTILALQTVEDLWNLERRYMKSESQLLERASIYTLMFFGQGHINLDEVVLRGEFSMAGFMESQTDGRRKDSLKFKESLVLLELFKTVEHSHYNLTLKVKNSC
jgi:hypothetical protein